MIRHGQHAQGSQVKAGSEVRGCKRGVAQVNQADGDCHGDTAGLHTSGRCQHHMNVKSTLLRAVFLLHLGCTVLALNPRHPLTQLAVGEAAEVLVQGPILVRLSVWVERLHAQDLGQRGRIGYVGWGCGGGTARAPEQTGQVVAQEGLRKGSSASLEVMHRVPIYGLAFAANWASTSTYAVCRATSPPLATRLHRSGRSPQILLAFSPSAPSPTSPLWTLTCAGGGGAPPRRLVPPHPEPITK
jgi:hypothetical protein